MVNVGMYREKSQTKTANHCKVKQTHYPRKQVETPVQMLPNAQTTKKKGPGRRGGYMSLGQVNYLARLGPKITRTETLRPFPSIVSLHTATRTPINTSLWALSRWRKPHSPYFQPSRLHLTSVDRTLCLVLAALNEVLLVRLQTVATQDSMAARRCDEQVAGGGPAFATADALLLVSELGFVEG